MKLGKHTWTKPQLLLLAAFAAYVWVQLWCARWYDPWRDVSQAWCIVRDLSIPQIFAQLRYEGHPFLWYALLWPLAKLGLPFESILVLSTALMVGAAAVLVRFAPLPWYAKAACLFSVPFIYYLPTVARSYALAGLLLVLCAALYGARAHAAAALCGGAVLAVPGACDAVRVCGLSDGAVGAGDAGAQRAC